MLTDDLVALLRPPPGVSRSHELAADAENMRFRQGTLLAWDPDDFTNTVRVAGGELTNVPILNAAAAQGFAAGDTVSLMVAGGTWGILGNFVIPGTEAATAIVDRLSIELGERVVSGTVAAAESTASATYTDLTTPGPEVEVTIGASGKALVIVGCRQVSTTANPVMSYEISGATTVAADDADSFANSLAGGGAISLLASGSRLSLAEGLNPGLTTFTAKYRRVGATTITFDQRNITVFAL